MAKKSLPISYIVIKFVINLTIFIKASQGDSFDILLKSQAAND